MKKLAAVGLLAMAGSIPATALAEASMTQTIAGTRLDVTATGEVSRVPDLAIISAGVISRSPTAGGALQDSGTKMNQVLAALKRSGVDERDIQTSNVNLSAEYKYPDNQAPQLVGYTASNNVTVRFRDIRTSGNILDALVAQGANQISGPTLTVDHPEAALDQARVKAVATGRARAELYARSLGLHLARIVSVSESEGGAVEPPRPMMVTARMAGAESKIEPGEQKLQVTVSMTFELQ